MAKTVRCVGWTGALFIEGIPVAAPPFEDDEYVGWRVGLPGLEL